jgi:hypothetical protein
MACFLPVLMIARPLNRHVLQSPFGHFAAQCLSILFDREAVGKLAFAAPVSFDLGADAVIETQKSFVCWIFDCHEDAPQNATLYGTLITKGVSRHDG